MRFETEVRDLSIGPNAEGWGGRPTPRCLRFSLCFLSRARIPTSPLPAGQSARAA